MLRGASGEHEIVIYGVLLILIMIFMPEGVVVWIMNRIKRRRLEKTRKLPAYDEVSP